MTLLTMATKEPIEGRQFKCDRRGCLFVCSTVGAIMLFVGAFLMELALPSIIKMMVRRSMVLDPHDSQSMTYPMWTKIPFPIKQHFYAFNYTNAQEVIDGIDTQFNVTEIGPFLFDEIREKENITWYLDEAQVEYGQVRKWIPTGGHPLEEPITHLNVPIVAAISMSQSFIPDQSPEFIYYIFDGIMRQTNTTAFQSHDAKTYLFDGYQDDFLKELVTNPPSFAPKIPFDHFGWFYSLNNTVSDGYFKIITGQSETLDRLGRMTQWNNQSDLSNYWYGEACNSFNDSSAGDFQPPFPEKRPDAIHLFVGDICSSIKLEFVGEVEVKGVKANRYAATGSLYNYSLPENQCFCESVDNCPMSGTLDISKCKYGAPAVVSLPHFLYSDQSDDRMVNGMEPDEEKHGFFMDLHPALMVPLRVAARMQINVVMKPVRRVRFMQYMLKNHPKEFYLPAIWFSGEAELDEPMANQLIWLDRMPLIIHISTGLMAVGLLACLLTAIHLDRNHYGFIFPRKTTNV